ncbi:MAG TPA: glycosyltransferase [Candidatus Polarisedimenticolia bacterium]|nr:glycosyltransferase [Candidatus Polarisedimenticolia bacterium]
MSRRPIRVMILIGQLRQGGAERQVHELVRRVDRERFEISVVTFEPGGHYQSLIEAAGVRVRVLQKAGWREPAALIRLAGMIRQGRYDLVHAFLFPAYWRAALASRLAGGIPVVAAVRTIRVWEGARLRLMDSAALRSARVVLGNAPSVRKHLIDTVGLVPERVRVILNGVDTEAFRPGPCALAEPWAARDAGRGPLVGFIGSLRQAKDPALFIRIAAAVARRAPSTRFVIVGEGELRVQLEAQAAGAGLNGSLVFTGPRADAPEVLRALDLLAVTSEREGCCNVILEAMATGVPVCATAVGGNPDLVSQGADGFLFPHGDVDAGAEAIGRLVADAQERRRLSEAALRKARSRFAAATMVRATESLYEELA